MYERLEWGNLAIPSLCTNRHSPSCSTPPLAWSSAVRSLQQGLRTAILQGRQWYRICMDLLIPSCRTVKDVHEVAQRRQHNTAALLRWLQCAPILTALLPGKTKQPRANQYCCSLILPRVRGCCVTYNTGFGLDDWIDCTLFTQLGTTGNTTLLLIYILYSSPLHTHYDSQSSLVVSWQRIYNSLTVTSNHT
jgi:hypothetical protein